MSCSPCLNYNLPTYLQPSCLAAQKETGGIGLPLQVSPRDPVLIVFVRPLFH